MMPQISLSDKIYGSIFKAKETQDNEYNDAYNDALNWITDILKNEIRDKKNECEICNSDKKLQQHHVRGRKHGNETITVCLPCHGQLTNEQRLWDRSWLDPNSENRGAFLERGLIDICELKYDKTDQEIYKLIAENLTRGFSYE